MAASTTGWSSTGPDIESHLAGHDARDVEQIVDELPLGVGVAVDDFQRSLGRRGVEDPIAQHPGPAEHRVQRRPQFVGQRGEELVLERVGRLGLGAGGLLPLVEPRVVDRRGDLGGQPQHDLLFTGREHARVGMTEEQAAQHLSRPRDDRHGQVAADRQMSGRHAVVAGHCGRSGGRA